MTYLNTPLVIILLTVQSSWIAAQSEADNVNNFQSIKIEGSLSGLVGLVVTSSMNAPADNLPTTGSRVLRSIPSGQGRSVQIVPTSPIIDSNLTASITKLMSEILKEEGQSLTSSDSSKATFNVDDLHLKDYLPATPSIKSDRKSDPDVDDIISGIIRLLGGKVNVKVAKPERPRPRPQNVDSQGPSSTRINNRGPPDLTLATILPPGLANNPNRPVQPLQPIPLPRPSDEDQIAVRPSSHVRWPDERPQYNLHRPDTQGYPLSHPGPITGIPLPVQIVPDHIEGLLPPDPPNFTNNVGDSTSEAIPTKSGVTEEYEEEVKETTEVMPSLEDLEKDTLTLPPVEHINDAPSDPPFTPSSITLTIRTTPPSPQLSENTSVPIITSQTSEINSIVTPSPSSPPASSVLQTASTQSHPSQVDIATSFIPLQNMFSELEGSLQEFGSSLTFKPLKTDTLASISSSISSSEPITPTPELSIHRPTKLSSSRPGYVFHEPRPDIITGQVFTEDIHRGEIFDITVSAHQGFGGTPTKGKPHVIPVNIDHMRTRPPSPNHGIITSPDEKDQYVFIDGHKTYINLTPTDPYGIEATQYIGTGGHQPQESPQSTPSRPSIVRRPDAQRPKPNKKPFLKRPTPPPVRIDTCIVGDDSTCEANRHEVCRTEYGVSSCNCRPGYARKRPRETCKKVVSLLVSMKVDKLNDEHIGWKKEYRNAQSEDYQRLEWESENGIAWVLEHSPLSKEYMGCSVNNLYHIGGTVVVNATLVLSETNRNTSLVKRELMESMGRAILDNSNRIGDSDLYVVGPQNPVPLVEDLNECNGLHDCSENALCINTLGSFECQCLSGYTDKFIGQAGKEGRACEACNPGFCHNRGECKVEKGHQICVCRGSFMGVRCEMDGEVLGVALGASLAAAVIIILTLIFLCMWSRRWKREQQKSDLLSGNSTSGFTYLSKANLANYRPGMEDRVRWPQYADPISQNIYTQPDVGPTPYMSTAVASNKSYPGTLSQSITAAQMKSLRNQSRTPVHMDSSEDDLDDHELLGHSSRAFHIPRPKSRTSYASQPGMYYDVDFNQPSPLYHPQAPIPPIPMATYAQNIRSFYN